MKRLSRRKVIEILLTALAISTLATIAAALGYLDGLQKKTLDLFIAIKGEQRLSEIIIVAIDEDAFARMGSSQPLNRMHLASLISFLQLCEPRTIGLDVELKTATRERDDAALLQAVSKKVVLPYTISYSGISPRVQTSRILQHDSAMLKGYANSFIDNDGIVRKSPLRLIGEDGSMLRSFAAVLYESAVKTGKPLPENILINYAGPAGTYPTFPAGPLLMLAAQKITPSADNPFRGKNVLVGAAFEASRDFVLTPHGRMSGVEAQANILNTLLTDSYIRTPHWSLFFGIQLVISFVFGFLVSLVRGKTAMLIALPVIIACIIPLSYYLYAEWNYWFDFIIPLGAVMASRAVFDRLERRRIRDRFSSYVSSDVARCVYSDDTLLDGRRFELSVLFADLQGFTTIAENLPPERLSVLLNHYYAFLTEAVLRNGGMLNKFIGDAGMAVYGAPMPRQDHADCAVKTAFDMMHGLQGLNDTLAGCGLPPLAIRIGIHSGPAFAGNIGTARRQEYAVVGDTVNIASRLESMNKELNTSCLISETTWSLLQKDVAANDMGYVTVKGRQNELKAYSIG